MVRAAMTTESFYAALTPAAFALLGLWWVAVAERLGEWMHDPVRRRQAYSVSLYFTLPGIMSMVSLVSTNTVLWRTGFGLAGLLGFFETIAFARRALGDGSHERRLQALLLGTLPLYPIVVAVAIHPTLAHDVGIALKPLETEAIIVSLLLFLGINLAWALFLEKPVEAK